MRQSVEVTIRVLLDVNAELSAAQLQDAVHDALLCPLADLEALNEDEGDLQYVRAAVDSIKEEATLFGNA